MEDPAVVLMDRVGHLQSSLLPLSPALLVVGTLVVLLAIALLPSRAYRAVSSLPRPPSTLPFLGNTLEAMSTYRHTLPTYLLRECLRFEGKPFLLSMLTKPPMVVLSSVPLIEDVLKTHFHKFGKGYEFAEALRDVFGRGIFVTDGPVWQHQRKTASHLFSMPMMRDIMDPVMVEHTDQLCEIVATAARENKAIDMKHLMELYATDVFTKIGFGVDLQFMTSGNHEFFDRFSRANQNLLYRNEQPMAIWRLKQWLSLGVEKQQKEDMAWLDKFVYGIIQDSMARKHTQDSNPALTPTPASKKDVITLFLDNPSSKLAKSDGSTSGEDEFDVTEIRDMAFAFISAGRDTTAFGMAWFLIMMAQFPDVQTKIRAELSEKLPALMAGELQSPSKEQTSDLIYLEACIKENLRLNPVIPLNTRESVEDVTLSDGTFLAKGTQVLIPAYAMARLTSVWGPDAAEFKPERWINKETGKLITISPFKFLTFSAGPRICPGKQFSMMEMKIALAALMAKFQISTEKDPRSFQYETSLTLGIEGPIMMRPAFVNQSTNGV